MTTDISTRLATIQTKTRIHRRQHGCGAYTFEDGPALIKIVQSYQPSKILELGTGLGYTACCLAYGSPQAEVDTIEGDVTHIALARQNIAEQGMNGRITVHHGDFADVMVQLNRSSYGLAFFDGFAPDPKTLAMIRDLLAVGGVLVCANLPLTSGRGDAADFEEALNNEAHWQRLDDIEGGQTAVLIKR